VIRSLARITPSGLTSLPRWHRHQAIPQPPSCGAPINGKGTSPPLGDPDRPASPGRPRAGPLAHRPYPLRSHRRHPRGIRSACSWRVPPRRNLKPVRGRLGSTSAMRDSGGLKQSTEESVRRVLEALEGDVSLFLSGSTRPTGSPPRRQTPRRLPRTAGSPPSNGRSRLLHARRAIPWAALGVAPKAAGPRLPHVCRSSAGTRIRYRSASACGGSSSPARRRQLFAPEARIRIGSIRAVRTHGFGASASVETSEGVQLDEID